MYAQDQTKRRIFRLPDFQYVSEYFMANSRRRIARSALFARHIGVVGNRRSHCVVCLRIALGDFNRLGRQMRLRAGRSEGKQKPLFRRERKRKHVIQSYRGSEKSARTREAF